MKLRLSILCLLLAVLTTVPVLAQGAGNARVSGTVTDSDGAVLPGVTVTFASPQLQGVRVLVTDENGAYSSPPLAPGEYEVTFQLEGFQTLTRKVRLSAGYTVTVDAELPLSSVAEEIVVTGEAVETISESTTAATTMTNADLEDLPVARTLNSAISLAPNVGTTGPGSGNAITISGAQSWENLFTLNGVVLNENVRGQAFDLFIEDAIQETTTATAGVSAEYGRFTGGVVTAITKSGGNRFEGSYRGSWTNQDWVSRNEFSPEREDKLNRTDEATIGGRVIRDRLWFFGAGRDVETDDQETTSILNIPYAQVNSEERYEIKLTGAITPSHQLQAAHTEIEEIQTNVAHGGLGAFAILTDDGTVDPERSLPQELNVYNYTGVLTQNFFLEAQVAEREFTFEGTGGQDQSIDTGTPIFDLAEGVVYNESLFCDDTQIPSCNPEQRDNDAQRVKANYFLSTDTAGSHDIAFGYETFSDIRAADNHQSPNDLNVWNFVSSTIDQDAQTVLPNFVAGGTFLMHLPILSPAMQSSLDTDSLFVNDRWRLNDNWSFNLGVRYDANESVNSAGLKVADDEAFSPRLGATWDIKGDGSWVGHLSAARYVGPQAEGIFNGTSVAGSPSAFGYLYLGEPIGPVFGNPLSSPEAVQRVVDWVDGVCPNAIDESDPFAPGDPFSCPELLAIIDIPGATTVLDDNLGSTTADEISIGLQHDFGRRGLIRVDYVHREFGDFFLTKRDLQTGKGFDDSGNPFDLGVVVNDDNLLEREYDAISAAFNFRFLDSKLRVGGNVTLSDASGNFDGETSGSGPVTSGVGEYPEYRDLAWNAPKGALGIDQEYRARVWVLYDLLNTEYHRLNASLLQSFFAGVPYEAVATVDTTPFVTNPGYETPPSDGVDYFFSGRGAFTTDDIQRTDLSLNYSFNVGRWELFVQPEVLNVFDADGVVDVNTSVLTAQDDPSLEEFNPFTTEPVEGVHWRKGSNFGKALAEDDLQLPRTFRISAGIRFNP